jgi:PadR family transcriptional regulator PadR
MLTSRRPVAANGIRSSATRARRGDTPKLASCAGTYLFITKVGFMYQLDRVTPATLDVLQVLIDAEEDLHGFAIAHAARRPTGSTYTILAKLTALGWLTSYWEASHPDEGRPRRRFYRLQPDGQRAARSLLLERRSQRGWGLIRRQAAPRVTEAW